MINVLRDFSVSPKNPCVHQSADLIVLEKQGKNADRKGETGRGKVHRIRNHQPKYAITIISFT